MKFKLGCGKKEIREHLKKNNWTTNGRHNKNEMWMYKNTEWMTIDEAKLYIWALYRRENIIKYSSKIPLKVDIIELKKKKIIIKEDI
jgi:hypothetical protein